ncbi:MAG: glycine cleavage system aminomethyltransferase GcvT [Oligoflexales bacterium]|nr:glycine cleavage system aminomethyltransferase GcvT [Oligoflexales bacterium]
MKKTALYEQHSLLKAKLIDFSGWKMPISYDGVLAEHHHVREKVGIFDVSHMGEFWIRGRDAQTYLQYLTINDVNKLDVGQGQYTAICNENGGMIDDLILYKTGEEEFFACVNAANITKDFEWFKQGASRFERVDLENASEGWSQIAVQGPNSEAAVLSLVNAQDQERIAGLPYTHIADISFGGSVCKLARTGYTGEKGYEIYLPNSAAASCWQALLATEPQTQIKPIGLGARDTLRLESCYLLYGNDMDESVSPLEAGISWATKLGGEDFCGKSAIASQKTAGVSRKIAAFLFEDQGVPRKGMQILKDGEDIGVVTSGSVFPSVGGSGGLALIASNKAVVGDLVQVNVRGKHKNAKLVKKPFYKAKTKD